jgi:hypothetical protein
LTPSGMSGAKADVMMVMVMIMNDGDDEKKLSHT